MKYAQIFTYLIFYPSFYTFFIYVQYLSEGDQIDLNMSDLWQIVCSKYSFNSIAFVALLYEMTNVLCELYTEVCIRGFVIKETRKRPSRMQDWPGTEALLVICFQRSNKILAAKNLKMIAMCKL